LKVNKTDLKKHLFLVNICALIADQRRLKKPITWVLQAALGIKDGLEYKISDDKVLEIVNTVDQEFNEAIGRIMEMKKVPTDEEYLI
jgi:hypothetical protein